MLKAKVILMVSAVIISLSPQVVCAQDGKREGRKPVPVLQKTDSVNATGTGTAASVAQAAEESEGEFEPALGLLIIPAGGGIAAGLLLGGGGGSGDDGDSTAPVNTSQ